ncbi:MAG: DUF4867 family protein [Tannerella sp.]|jgi:hypothetical protein|nr:DUF4867 family protein [Tannerella sp.]
MVTENLVSKNAHIEIKEISHESFRAYGAVITDYDFTDAVNYMENETFIPEEGNIYKASEPGLESLPVKGLLENGFYGEMPVQIGYCNGRNSTLNGLEYHRGSEIDVAATDLVLLLGRLHDMKGGYYHSKDVEAFFIPESTAVQLYETTLHFAPCKTTSGGFKCMVVLPRGTNEALANDKSKYGDKYLFARNKWLLAHPDRTPLVQKGAWPGITGDNIEILI